MRPLLGTALLLLVVTLGGCSEKRSTQEDAALAGWRSWDERRAQAWADGDAAALARLYEAGSAAGRSDVAALRAWTARGWRVEGLRSRVLGVVVQASSPGRLRLELVTRTDPAARARPSDGASPVRLPADAPRRRIVTLVRRDGAWQMAG